MTDEDLQRLVRALQRLVAVEFEAVHERLDHLERRIGEVETGLLNEIKALSRRIGRLEAL